MSNSSASQSTSPEEAADRPQLGATASGGQRSRKRKVTDPVTPNACLACKKARTKCDGATPACRRCTHRGQQDECRYEMHTKTAKEQMVREILRLQTKTEHLEGVKNTLEEKNKWIESIMASLKDDGQGSEIINRLKRGESHEAIAHWLGRPLPQEVTSLSPNAERSFKSAIETYHRDLVENQDPRYWTNVFLERDLIEHLIKLYFTWVHPVHMFFDEANFLESFKTCSDVYCSSALVNVICAMSCFLLHTAWRTDDAGGQSPGVSLEDTQAAICFLRDQFMAQTTNALNDADPEKMTTIQTYAVMFLVDVACGKGLEATAHIRVSTEGLTAKRSREQSSEAEDIAAWGVLTAHTAWSGFIFQKPTAPVSPLAHPFEHMDTKQSGDVWVPHKQIGEKDSAFPQRPGYTILTIAEQAKLYRIVHETILVYCGNHGKVSARSLAELYNRFLSWMERLPIELRLKDSDPLPHVLFLHIQYHTAVVNLLQPLLQLGSSDKASLDQIWNVLVRHAKTGVDLLYRYQITYSDHFVTPLQLFCLVHLCDALVRYDGQGEATGQATHFCLRALEEAKTGYPVAGPLQKMFRTALTEYQIPVSRELERMMSSTLRLGAEELIKVCTRPTYRLPFSQLLQNTQKDLSQQFVEEWQRFEDNRQRIPKERQNCMDIGAMLNG